MQRVVTAITRIQSQTRLLQRLGFSALNCKACCPESEHRSYPRAITTEPNSIAPKYLSLRRLAKALDSNSPIQTRYFTKVAAGSTKVPPRVTALYEQIQEALAEMIEENPGLVVTIAGEVMTIDLPNDQGQYIFRYVETIPAAKAKVPSTGDFPSPIDLHVVQVMSPVSASAYKYTFCPANLWWTSMDTGSPHLLMEILTRELMKVCRGYPNF